MKLGLLTACLPEWPLERIAHWAGLGESFEGLIDEVHIYNRALGAGEIAADAGL